jgi:hypothetical protein
MIAGEVAMSLLKAWSGFYLMTSSSAAALTGLMFIVITLVTGTERLQKSPDGISTFSTPTVVHFCAALFISAVLSAPWSGLITPAIVLALAGVYGIVYLLRVTHRTRRLSNYNPDIEDWAWYSVLPFFAYGAILAGAILLAFIPAKGLFVLAGGVLGLIFIGIRNAWDVVTFIAIGGPASTAPTARREE